MLKNHSPLSTEFLFGKATSHPSPISVGERDAPSPSALLPPGRDGGALLILPDARARGGCSKELPSLEPVVTQATPL